MAPEKKRKGQNNVIDSKKILSEKNNIMNFTELFNLYVLFKFHHFPSYV